jgi:protein-disulfide isomerase
VGACLAAESRAADLTAQVRQFAVDYFPWEPDTRITVKTSPSLDCAGLHAYTVERKGKYEKLDATQTWLISPDEKWIFTGVIIRNSAEQNKTRPVESNEDVVGVATYFSQLFHAKAQARLDPSNDRAGVKALTVVIDTGTFYQTLHEAISSDASCFFFGQWWRFDQSLFAQRKAIMNLSDAPAQGAAQPKITMVEYADMECPFCKKRGQKMDKLMETWGPKLGIRRYYKYYPLWTNHVWSTRAASAAACFSRVSPDLVFKFKELCYERQETLTLAGIDELVFNFADANGMSREDFLGCYLREPSLSVIQRNVEEGGRLGVSSTPTYYLNGVEINWLPDDVMEEYLKSLASPPKK